MTLEVLVEPRGIKFLAEFDVSVPAPQARRCRIVVTPGGRGARPTEVALDLVEYRRPTDRAASYHQASGACRFEAGGGGSGIHDVTVSNHRDVDCLDDLANLLPIGCA